jgi:hypothetical protein
VPLAPVKGSWTNEFVVNCGDSMKVLTSSATADMPPWFSLWEGVSYGVNSCYFYKC